MNNRKKAVDDWKASRTVKIGAFWILCLLPLSAQAQNSSYNQTILTTLSKISASGASGQFDTAEQLFRDGKDTGLSELQMYEAVLNLLPYIGYPRTLSTLGRFQKVYPDYIAERSQGEALKSNRALARVRPQGVGRTRSKGSGAAGWRKRSEQKSSSTAQSDQS